MDCMAGATITTSMGYGSMLIPHILTAQKVRFNPMGDFWLITQQLSNQFKIHKTGETFVS